MRNIEIVYILSSSDVAEKVHCACSIVPLLSKKTVTCLILSKNTVSLSYCFFAYTEGALEEILRISFLLFAMFPKRYGFLASRYGRIYCQDVKTSTNSKP